MYKNPIVFGSGETYQMDEKGRLVIVDNSPAEVEVNINFVAVDQMKQKVYNRLVQSRISENINSGIGSKTAMEVEPFPLKQAFQPVVDAVQKQEKQAVLKRENLKTGFKQKLTDTANQLAASSKKLTDQVFNTQPDAIALGLADGENSLDAAAVKKFVLKPWMKYTLIGLAVVGVLALLYVLAGEEKN